MNIILVEDEAIAALDLKMRLEGFGHTVLAHTVNGPDAVRLARELQPDLILMDIKIKGDMDGIEAARIIHDTDDIPIVFLTAFSDKPTLKRSMDAAPSGYVLKPVNDRDLFVTLETALTRYKLEIDLKRSLAIEKVFSEIASRAALASTLDDFLPDSLRSIGQTLKVDRSYFLAYNPVSQTISNTHEWCTPGIESAIDAMEGEPAREGSYFFDKLQQGRYFACSDIEEIEDPGTRELVRRQDIKAMVLFSVSTPSEFLGIIGFDDCRQSRSWNQEELRVLETMVDLLISLISRIRSEERLRHRLSVEDMIVHIFDFFVNTDTDKIDRAIDHTLMTAGRALEVDRAFIFRLKKDGKVFAKTHEWCAEGIKSLMKEFQHEVPSERRYFYKILFKKESLIIPDIEALPEEAANEKTILRNLNIRSLLILPIFLKGELKGFFGFDSVQKPRSWEEANLQLLIILGQMCLGTLERMEAVRSEG